MKGCRIRPEPASEIGQRRVVVKILFSGGGLNLVLGRDTGRFRKGPGKQGNQARIACHAYLCPLLDQIGDQTGKQEAFADTLFLPN